MRIRNLRPEFWSDSKLARNTTPFDRLLLKGLDNLADEHGRIVGEPEWIKGQLFAYDTDVTGAVIAESLGRLAAPVISRVRTYEVDGEPYLYLPQLGDDNKLEPWKSKSRLPAPPLAICPACACLSCRPDLYPAEASARRGLDLSGKSLAERALDGAAREPGATQSERGADLSGPGADLSGPRSDLPALSYGVGVRVDGVGVRDAGVPGSDSVVAGLLQAHAAAFDPPAPGAALDPLRQQITDLLTDCTPEEIAAGLAMLRSRPDLGPGVLPHLVHEVRQRRAQESRAPDPAFEDLVSLHPDANRKRARAAWDRAVTGGADPQALARGYRAYAGSCPDKHYQARPSTWLDDRRWEGGGPADALTPPEQAELDRLIDDALRANTWSEDPGESIRERREMIAEIGLRFRAERSGNVRPLRAAAGGVA